MSEPGAARINRAALRREEIMRRLQSTGFVSVTRLTKELAVSDMTVRRDLKRLAEAGQLRVVHGGASLLHGTLRTADFASRGERQKDAKQQIARRALDFVAPGASIAVDAGTTPFELAAALPEDFNGAVITHSIPVLQHMLHRPVARVIGLGGELLADSQALVGALTVQTLAGLRADVAFIGAAAVSAGWIFVSTDHERPTKLALMDIADRVVLLADHTKFDASAPVRLAPLSQVDVLVTDAPVGAHVREALADAGVTVVVSNSDGATRSAGAVRSGKPVHARAR